MLDRAREWLKTISSPEYRPLSNLISATRLTFKTGAQSLVPFAYNLDLGPESSTQEDVHYKEERVSHLLRDLNFFLWDDNGVRLLTHPALRSLILTTIFPSHGGKLSPHVDRTQLDVVFALAGTAIYCALTEYRSGAHCAQEFGQEMYTTFRQCLDKLAEVRRDERLCTLLDTFQERVMQRGLSL